MPPRTRVTPEEALAYHLEPTPGKIEINASTPMATQRDLSSAQQTVAWEAMKAEERAENGESGVLDGVARALPALTRAAKLGKRAGRVGFDWPDAVGVRAKVDEELAEFEAKLAADPQFAADPTARLQWFYQRTKFHDDRYLLYPVGIER